MEDGSQPLCYSFNLKNNMDDRCLMCKRDSGAFDLYLPYDECYCKPGAKIYKTAVLCKVFVTTTPAHNLDITTPIRYDIYDLSGKLETTVDRIFNEIHYDHWNDYPVTHSVVLDGSLIQDSYHGILAGVIPDFILFDWDFKGKYSRDRYIEFAEQRLRQTYDMPLQGTDLEPENDHFGRRKKGATHVRDSPAKGKKGKK